MRSLNPTELQLIFQFLSIEEHARAIRVCATWSQAARQPLSWPKSITCNNDQIEFLVAHGCKKPTVVVGHALARRHFRPPGQWTEHLKVLHLSSLVSHESPPMSADTAHTTLQGCVNLEELHWHDLYWLPQDFKWPAGLRRLELQFWISRSVKNAFNPKTLPVSLESLSIAHKKPPGSHCARTWMFLHEAVPFHCRALHTLNFSADGNIAVFAIITAVPFESTQLRRLHINALMSVEQLEHVIGALAQKPLLEDLMMPEFFTVTGVAPNPELIHRLAPSLRTLWIHADWEVSPRVTAHQAQRIADICKGLQLKELFFYNDANDETESMAKGVAGMLSSRDWMLCGHAYYDQMESCKHRQRMIHFIKKRADESDYETDDSD